MRLKLSIGKTINMGNYESLRVDTGVEQEYMLDKPENMADRFDELYSHLVEILNDISNRAKGEF